MAEVEALANAMPSFCEERKAAGKPAVFDFGSVYGAALKYENQPVLAGILENRLFIQQVMP